MDALNLLASRGLGQLSVQHVPAGVVPIASPVLGLVLDVAYLARVDVVDVIEAISEIVADNAVHIRRVHARLLDDPAGHRSAKLPRVLLSCSRSTLNKLDVPLATWTSLT